METFLVVLEDSDRRASAFVYWTITVCGGPFQAPSTNGRFSHFVAERQLGLSRLTTRDTQRPPAITRVAFELFPFRSPLLRESFLFLEVLRCFSSLGALHAPYEFGCG